MNMNPSFDTIGRHFVVAYYQVFDSNRAGLQSFYGDTSMLTFEGAAIQGASAITAKLTSLPFKTVQHITTTVDCQPTPNGGVLVHVVGQLKTDDDPPHGFSHTFHLMPDPMNADSYFLFNDIFRLTLHNI